MPRVKKGAAVRRKHKKVLKAARGYYGALSRRYHLALQKTFRSGVFATRDRKDRKREFRALWITRLSAACRQRRIRYSAFIAALADKGIIVYRKMLSEIAIADPSAFDAVCQAAGMKIETAAAAN
ncbi:MAG: 50S ribosomal protein L20 [Planctomycetes bacterium]|nr:50S ribosomal protein L20 [Planctomycetota bacterium]